MLGDLAGREVLLIGAGKMSERAAHYLMKAGANQVKVMNRTAARGEELAEKMGATPVSFEDRFAASEKGRHRSQLDRVSACASSAARRRKKSPKSASTSRW